ncbi:MAG: hypothetical protein P8X63_12955, partial [Desulfuromonadaceae bacterium]
PQSLASIEQTENWNIEPICGYEGCYPLVDTLVGNNLRVRFDTFNHQYSRVKNPFSMVLTFSMPQSYECTFSPLSTQIKKNEESKIFASNFVSYGSEKIDSTISNQKIIQLSGKGKPIQGKKYQAVSIQFPTVTPAPQETFQLFLEGLVCNGENLRPPVVTFSEGMCEW